MQIGIPTLVRVKDGALDKLGVYLSRNQHQNVAVLISSGLTPELVDRARRSLALAKIDPAVWLEVKDNSFEATARIFADLPKGVAAIIGLGGGKALDVAKYISYLARRPYYAVPTSLSNDGFCSPQSSLTIRGKRQSLASTTPFGVIIDTAVCRAAPRILTLSGIGDLVAKFTAVRDWKLAFHATGELVNDLAALLSDGSIRAFLDHPEFDEEGFRLLATGLLLNGVAMEICDSSRPASGGEHLISHALDATSARPRMHGLQVGVATYIVSILQQLHTDRIADVFTATGFWDAIAADPFLKSEWRIAIRMAPSIKAHFYTVLSSRDTLPEIEKLWKSDPFLQRCFID